MKDLVPNRIRVININTQITTKFGKPIDLPDSEMDREQQHVNKVLDGAKPYELVRGNYDYDESFMTSGAPQNPISHANFTMFEKSGNNSSKVVAVTQGAISTTGCHSSKVNYTSRESTKGLPKWSNSYGDGDSILGRRRNLFAKVSQRKYSTDTSAVRNKVL